MAQPRYTREGRVISDNGKEIIAVTREVDALNLSHITPHDCDRLTAHIVELLNRFPLRSR